MCQEAFGSNTLQFTSNRNKTCYISGIGSCTDTDIIIPVKSPKGDSVIGIGERAFADCDNITSITIPKSVTNIAPSGFIGCDNLESIIINQDNSKYHVTDNCIIETEAKTLVCGLKTV